MNWDYASWERHMRIMRKEEREEGRIEGRLEGQREGRLAGRKKGGNLLIIKLIQKMVKRGKTFEEIADELEIEGCEIEMIYHQVLERGVDCDPEEILNAIQEIQEKDLTFAIRG